MDEGPKDRELDAGEPGRRRRRGRTPSPVPQGHEQEHLKGLERSEESSLSLAVGVGSQVML